MRKLTVAFLGLISISLLASHSAAVQDCNENGVPDVDDLDNATSADVNANAIPDECERCAVDESIKLTASSAAFNDRFAFDVALDADTALVGAPRSDRRVFDGGAAYLYRLDGSDWIEEAQLTAFDAAGLDHFGTAVALSGDVVVVGAPDDDDAGSGSGAAYVFRFDGSDWVFETKLVASSAAAGDSFGAELLVAGDVIVVGAPGSGVAADNAGAAFVFRFDGEAWIEEAELTASDAASGDDFGRSVALHGDLLLVASPRDDDGGAGAGSVYQFRFAQNVWAEEAKLTASDASANDAFGTSVALTAEYALIGSPYVDDAGPNAGAVYCFRYDRSSWIEQARIAPHDLAPGDHFGAALSAEAHLAVIAATGDDQAAGNAGAAYAYVFDGSNWMALAKFTATDAAWGDGFANSIAVSDGKALVAAWQNDHAGFASGSAYAYHGLSDCNANDALDICDIAAGVAADLNGNFVPDECDPDCNANGVPDDLDIAWRQSMDCNANDVPDECDIAEGASADCDQNGVPDECQPDSDGDGVIDPCDACPATPEGVEVDADGCALVDPLEDLALESVCSDEPDVECRWKVHNPNAIDIELTWELGSSEQHGRFSARPGASFFRTKTVEGVNRVEISWKDELNRERGAVEESAGVPCDSSDSDGDGVDDEDDWCPDTPEGQSVDQHGCARKQKVALCHVPPGNSDNQHDIRVKPSAVEAHLAHGDFIGGCVQTEPEQDEHDEHGERHDDDDDREGHREDRGSKHDDEDGKEDDDDEVDPISPVGQPDRSENLDDGMPPGCGTGLLGMLPLMFAGLAGVKRCRVRRSTASTAGCRDPRTIGD